MRMEEAGWVYRWSQRAQGAEYVGIGTRALMGLDFHDLHHACIFNCSDGPSTAGLITGVQYTQPSMTFTISDISSVAVARCREYLTAEHIIASPDTMIAPTDLLPSLLPCTQRVPVDAYISFEPVGDSEHAYRQMWNVLPKGGQIAVAARGFLSHSFHYIRALSKSVGRDFDIYDSGIRYPQGYLVTVSMRK